MSQDPLLAPGLKISFSCFNIDVKGFKQRSISSPQNEIVIRGAQEAFVENLKANTSMLRRFINNENLVIMAIIRHLIKRFPVIKAANIIIILLTSGNNSKLPSL